MVIISSQLFLLLFLMVRFPPVRAGPRAGMGGKGYGLYGNSEPGDLLPPMLLYHGWQEISPLRSAAVEMTEGRDRCHSWHVIAGACIRSFSLLTI